MATTRLETAGFSAGEGGRFQRLLNRFHRPREEAPLEASPRQEHRPRDEDLFGGPENRARIMNIRTKDGLLGTHFYGAEIAKRVAREERGHARALLGVPRFEPISQEGALRIDSAGGDMRLTPTHGSRIHLTGAPVDHLQLDGPVEVFSDTPIRKATLRGQARLEVAPPFLHGHDGPGTAARALPLDLDMEGKGVQAKVTGALGNVEMRDGAFLETHDYRTREDLPNDLVLYPRFDRLRASGEGTAVAVPSDSADDYEISDGARMVPHSPESGYPWHYETRPGQSRGDIR